MVVPFLYNTGRTVALCTQMVTIHVTRYSRKKMTTRPLTIFPAFMAALFLVLSPAMTARADFFENKMTIRQENKMGQSFDLMIRTQMNIVEDTYITEYIADIVNKIVRGKRPMPFRIKSAVIANPLLNAFAIPGGYIYVFTGLIESVTSECQLAGVISHELAHVSQRHLAQRVEKQKRLSLLTTAGMLAGLFLGLATGGQNAAKAGQALMVGSQGAGVAAMLKYSQDDEREADHVGMNALVKAGYNPIGMPQTFEIMMKNKWFDTGSQMPSYLSTHPGTADRIIYLKDRIARMPKVFLKRKDDNTRLKRIQILIRSKMTPAKMALAYWTDKKKEYTPLDYIGLGIVQQRLKHLDDAEASFDMALHLDGEDPLVVREAGIFYFKTGNYEKATRLLQKATIKNSDDVLGLFFLSRAQAKLGYYKQAIRTMGLVEAQVPQDGDVFHYLGMIYGESGNKFRGNLYLSYGAVFYGNKKKAQYHYQKAALLAKTDEEKKALEQLAETIQGRDQLMR